MLLNLTTLSLFVKIFIHLSIIRIFKMIKYCANDGVSVTSSHSSQEKPRMRSTDLSGCNSPDHKSGTTSVGHEYEIFKFVK